MATEPLRTGEGSGQRTRSEGLGQARRSRGRGRPSALQKAPGEGRASSRKRDSGPPRPSPERDRLAGAGEKLPLSHIPAFTQGTPRDAGCAGLGTWLRRRPALPARPGPHFPLLPQDGGHPAPQPWGGPHPREAAPTLVIVTCVGRARQRPAGVAAGFCVQRSTERPGPPPCGGRPLSSSAWSP